ncbi:MAG: hypothetical protein HRU15_10835 [Planctomycetes bacterium]|nr:hypothetical protein [Planctomycetota bacterium]
MPLKLCIVCVLFITFAVELCAARYDSDYRYNVTHEHKSLDYADYDLVGTGDWRGSLRLVYSPTLAGYEEIEVAGQSGLVVANDAISFAIQWNDRIGENMYWGLGYGKRDHEFQTGSMETTEIHLSIGFVGDLTGNSLFKTGLGLNFGTGDAFYTGFAIQDSAIVMSAGVDFGYYYAFTRPGIEMGVEAGYYRIQADVTDETGLGLDYNMDGTGLEYRLTVGYTY